MQLRSDAVKVGVARAPHRSLLKADGLTDEEMSPGAFGRPFAPSAAGRRRTAVGR